MSGPSMPHAIHMCKDVIKGREQDRQNMLLVLSRAAVASTNHLPSGNVFWVFAVAGSVGVADLEHRSNWATVLTGDSFQTDVVFAAVVWVGVSREASGVAHFSWGWAREPSGDFFVLALWDLVSPHADAGFAVVRQTRGALVTGGFSVPAVPEDVAFGLVGEDTVQTRAVGC